MVLASGFALVLLVTALVDVLRTPAQQVRTLPKPLWLLVVLPPYFGPAAWLLAGRPRGGATRLPPTFTAPDDDEDFLRELRRRQQGE